MKQALFYNLACLVLILSPIEAQETSVAFERISTDKGPLKGTINYIMKDSRGFLWLATSNGLARYDGYSYKLFQHNPVDSNSISGNYIFCIAEDGNGDLWIGTSEKGLNRYIRNEGRFVRYRANPKALSSDDIVPWVYLDSKGNLWVACWSFGLARYDRSKDSFIHYVHDPADPHSLIDQNVHRIAEDHLGNLWIGTENGLCVLDTSRLSFTSFVRDSGNPRSLGGDYIHAIFEDQNQNLWIGSRRGGLSRFDRQTNSFTRHLGTASVTSVVEDADGSLWVGTDGEGLFRVNTSNGRVARFQSKRNNMMSISSNFVNSLFREKDGVLWIGTTAEGLNRLDPHRRKFTHIVASANDPQALNTPTVETVLEARNGDVWVGTYNGGVNRYEKRKGRFIYYRHDPRDPHSIGGNMIYALSEDEGGDIWVGTYGGGLSRFDHTREWFENYRHVPDDSTSLSSDWVTCLLHDRRGLLWVGTAGGSLNMFDPHRGTFVRYGGELPAAVFHTHIFSLLEDGTGRIWIGTWGGGLRFYDPVTRTFSTVDDNPMDHSSLSAGTVVSLAQDPDGFVWAGTWGDGLMKIDTATLTFTRYTVPDGLPHDHVYGVQPDDDGNIWISTGNGLTKFTPKTGVWRVYDESEGIQSREFRRGASYRGPSGRMYFGGGNGLNIFDPRKIEDERSSAPFLLTSFKVLGHEIPERDLGTSFDQLTNLRVRPGDNFFSFEFTLVDFTIPSLNRYEYFLEGFDKGWGRVEKMGIAGYTNVPPGEYTFRAKAINSKGTPGQNEIAIAVSVLPAIWETWWFRTLVLLLIAGFLYIVYRYRTNRLLEIERIRIRIASDLHDDIGSTLSKISLYSDLVRNDPGQKTSGNLITEIGTLSRDMVRTMNDAVWSIDARNDSLENLIDRMRDFAVSIHRAKGTLIRFDFDKFDKGKTLPADIRQNLYLIFKEAMNNIAKHAHATEVDVSLKNNNGLLSLIVKDNGKGFDDGSHGHGLRNMKMRAARIGGTLEVVNDRGVTVQLNVSVPSFR